MRGGRRRLPIAQPESARAHRTGIGRKTRGRSLRLSLPRPAGAAHGRRFSAVAPQKRSPDPGHRGTLPPPRCKARPPEPIYSRVGRRTRASKEYRENFWTYQSNLFLSCIGLSRVPGIVADRGSRLRAKDAHHVEMMFIAHRFYVGAPLARHAPGIAEPWKTRRRRRGRTARRDVR